MGYHYTKTMRAICHASVAPVMAHRPALYRVGATGTAGYRGFEPRTGALTVRCSAVELVTMDPESSCSIGAIKLSGPGYGVSGCRRTFTSADVCVRLLLFLHPATVLDERQGLGFAVAETRGCVATLNRVQEI